MENQNKNENESLFEAEKEGERNTARHIRTSENKTEKTERRKKKKKRSDGVTFEGVCLICSSYKLRYDMMRYETWKKQKWR